MKFVRGKTRKLIFSSAKTNLLFCENSSSATTNLLFGENSSSLRRKLIFSSAKTNLLFGENSSFSSAKLFFFFDEIGETFEEPTTKFVTPLFLQRKTVAD